MVKRKPRPELRILLQVINRDLSIAVLKYFIERRKEEIASGKLKPHRTWSRQQGGPAYVPETAKTGSGAASQRDAGDGIRVLEGLAATGLRSIRYACEVHFLFFSLFFRGGGGAAIARVESYCVLRCKCSWCTSPGFAQGSE